MPRSIAVMTFDPLAPLPGAPDPWQSSSMPAPRDGPPYTMTEMIAAEPAFAERLLTALRDDQTVRRLAADLRAAADAGEPVIFTGCGTSEHAAIACVAIVGEALRDAVVRDARIGSAQAFELLGRPSSSGVLVGVSHEGGTWATNGALREARDAGCQTALITVSNRSPGAQLAQVVVQTHEQDQSWCHTIGYLSPMLAATALAAAIRAQPVDPISVRAMLDTADGDPAGEAATILANCTRLVVVGSGADYGAARELALKVEEGVHLPSTAHHLETLRHGHLAATDSTTGLVIILTDAEQRGEMLLDRARAVLRSAAAIGMPAAGIIAADLGDDIPRDLTPAGRLAVPVTSRLPRVEVSLIGSAIPLQQLTERLARERGTNPDTIGRDDPRHAAAADA
jgi:glucosamine--fructose-6-phosphate aminotransferase (isomerizing)